MKKVLVLILAVVMVMSMAVPAAAAALSSPKATMEDLKPVLTEESTLIVEVHTTEDVMELSEEVQKVMTDAKEALKEVVPESFAVKYFFYVEIIGTENAVAVDFEAIQEISGSEAENAEGRLVVMQFVDGKWVELEFTINEDGTITIHGVVEGPIAFFVK